MSDTPEIFEKDLIVLKTDLDELLHVNNVRYVQWMEDIAKAHWEFRAAKQYQDRYIWMVLKHEIEYKSQAFLGDPIVLQTFIGGHTHVTTQRFVKIRNKSTNKILISAKSTWCLIDRETKKPAKISKEMFRDFYI